MTTISLPFSNQAKIDIQLTEEQMRQLTLLYLAEIMDGIEEGMNKNNISVWDAINEVIGNIAAPEELAQLESRDIPKGWVDLVAQQSELMRSA